MERDSARGGLKILTRFFQTGLGFSAWPNGPENLKKSHVIEPEFQPGLKSDLGHAQWFCFPGNKMAAAIKDKRCQWNKGDKIENLIRCLANFKAQMEYKNIETRLNSTRLSGRPWTRQAWHIFFLCKYVFLAKRQVSFQFHHHCRVLLSQKVKNWAPKKVKLREKQCAYFPDSCSRRHFDSLETFRSQFHICGRG